MTKKVPPVVLPRETNPVRILSQFRRSVRLMGKASSDAKAMPNIGTHTRRIERTLAAWSMSRKVHFIRTYGRTDIVGAAKGNAVRKAARSYRNALRQWTKYYQGNHSL